MVLNVFISQAPYLGLYLVKLFFRCLDSGCSCDGNTTKLFTKRKYINLYLGGDFDIGLRYSEVCIYYITLKDITLFGSYIKYLYLTFILFRLYSRYLSDYYILLVCL